MKKFLSLLLCEFVCFSLLAQFPTSVPNNNYYGVFTTGVSATLNTKVSPTDTTVAINNNSCTMFGISVNCTTAFVSNMIVQFGGQDLAQICSVNTGPGNTTILTFGSSTCPNSDGRSFSGSTAVTHNPNSPLTSGFFSWSYGKILTEITSIENFLLTTNVSITSNINITTTSYKPKSYQNITCFNNATFTLSGNIPIIDASGTTYVTFNNCNLINNNPSNSNNGDVYANKASFFTVNNLTITENGNNIAFHTLDSPNTSITGCNTNFYTNFNNTILLESPTQDSSNAYISCGKYSLLGGTTNTNGVIFTQNTGGIGVASTFNNVIIKDTQIYNGGSNFCITVQSQIFGIGPSPMSIIDIRNNYCKKTFHQSASGGHVSLGGYEDNATVSYNKYDQNNIADVFGQYETVAPRHVSFKNNQSINVAGTVTSGVILDGGNGGTDLNIDDNSLNANIGINLNPGVSANYASAYNVLDSTNIDNNNISNIASGDVCIAVQNSGQTATQAITEKDVVVSNNNCKGPNTGTSTMLFLYNSGNLATTDNIQFNTNHGSPGTYTYLFQSGNAGGASKATNVTLIENVLTGASGECNGGCDLSVISYKNNIGFTSITNVLYGSGLSFGACTVGTGSGQTGTCAANGALSTLVTGTTLVATLNFATGMTPATFNVIFTILAPVGYFSQIPIGCTVVNAYQINAVPAGLAVVTNTSGGTYSISLVSGPTALTGSVTYNLGIQCPKQ